LDWVKKKWLRKFAPDAVEDWENAETPDPLVIGTEKELEAAAKQLVTWLVQAKEASDGDGEIVWHVGAGVSTSSGVPDFRGQQGLWTSNRVEALPSLQTVKPSLTHRALVLLQQHGFCHHCVSQNYDNLLLRAGFPVEHVSEIHGNIFQEYCVDCGKKYMRDFEVEDAEAEEDHVTGRYCDDCGGILRDNIVHFGEQLNERESAEAHSRKAILSIALGTKLAVTPAADWVFLPKKKKKRKSKKNKNNNRQKNNRQKDIDNDGKVVLVNVQLTGEENRCDLVIHNYVDKVMARVLELLGLKTELK
jgi:NAD-dependent SIR2 family protein deacetylase